LAEALQSPDSEFKAKYGFNKPEKSEKLVIYCRSGNRAGRACAIAAEAGFTDILNYKGGWIEWSAHL